MYAVTAGPSRLSSGGVTIPFPEIETHQSTLVLIDGALVCLPTACRRWICIRGRARQDWFGPDNVAGVPVLSTEDMETVMDCECQFLVRLMGTGRRISQEGRPFELTIRLFAVVDGSLVGGSSWTVDGMTMRQRLVFTQTGG